jgi:hypothetical protein
MVIAEDDIYEGHGERVIMLDPVPSNDPNEPLVRELFALCYSRHTNKY